MAERISASNADKHMACPASANLELAIPGFIKPEKKKEGAAVDGTAAHDILEEIVKKPASQIDAYARVLTYLAELRKERRFQVIVEQELTAEWLVSKPKTKVDLAYYVSDQLEVIDYKWGKIEVPVVDNVQLLYYARCLAGLAPKAKGVRVHILQPFADNLNSWWISADRLAQFEAEMLAAEAKILAQDTTFGPSDHGCTFCPANPHSRGEKGNKFCPAMLEILYPKFVDEDEVLASLKE